MVTALNRQVPARELGFEMVQYICGRIAAVPSGADVTVLIGKLPVGAVINGIVSRVVTAINGGVDVDTENLVANLAATAGSQIVMPDAASGGPLDSDTEFYATITGGATVGVAYVAVLYYKPVK
jgi:hypothetical protein